MFVLPKTTRRLWRLLFRDLWAVRSSIDNSCIDHKSWKRGPRLKEYFPTPSWLSKQCAHQNTQLKMRNSSHAIESLFFQKNRGKFLENCKLPLFKIARIKNHWTSWSNRTPFKSRSGRKLKKKHIYKKRLDFLKICSSSTCKFQRRHPSPSPSPARAAREYNRSHPTSANIYAIRTTPNLRRPSLPHSHTYTHAHALAFVRVRVNRTVKGEPAEEGGGGAHLSPLPSFSFITHPNSLVW